MSCVLAAPRLAWGLSRRFSAAGATELLREWDGETDKDKLLELKPLEGAEPLRFGNRAIVVVRKGGAAQVIKRKYMKLRAIFGDKPFKLGKDTYYLTPIGRRRRAMAIASPN